MRCLRLLVLLLILATPALSLGAQEAFKREETIFAPRAGRFAVRLPANWQRIIRPREGADSMTLEPDSKRAALVLFFYPQPKEGLPNDEAIEKLARTLAQPFLASMVEQTPAFTRLESAAGKAVQTTLTDKKLVGVAKPKPGEYLYLTHGVLVLGDRVVMFGILHNERDGAEWKQAQRIVAEGLARK